MAKTETRKCIKCGYSFKASADVPGHLCEDCRPRDTIRWVSTADKLPRNHGGYVLITVLHNEGHDLEYTSVLTATRRSGLWEVNADGYTYEIYDNGNGEYDDKVIAWSALPKPCLYEGSDKSVNNL
ncbi:MAG: hypothetical protein LIO40_01065 [Ruminococcus sp.]|nr:hypothetical protein [Ruminococcus sp.]